MTNLGRQHSYYVFCVHNLEAVGLVVLFGFCMRFGAAQKENHKSEQHNN
jgi:hypothetical protein